MRIRYSVVIPALFIGFCLVFILLLYISEQAKREREEEARQAQKAFTLITEERRAVRGMLLKMQDDLAKQHLQEAVARYKEVKGSVQTMYDFARDIPGEQQRERVTGNIRGLEARLETLYDRLTRGDMKGAEAVIRTIIPSKRDTNG